MSWIVAILCLLISSGCTWFQGRTLPLRNPPLTVLVGPLIMAAPVTSPSDLYAFEQPPSPEVAPQLLAQLIEEVEVTGQRLLTEQVSRQPGLIVIPFAEARRLQTNDPSVAKSVAPEALQALGKQAGADIVVSGHIVDYGVVRWQYWVPGLLASMMTETLVVGAATGFNPAVMAVTAGSELLTDVPFWWGGAYVAGWALRPVRVEVEAVDVHRCAEEPWREEALVMLVPGKTLAEYPAEERRRKEVQLTVNLSRALAEIADSAGQELRRSPCAKPEPGMHEDA